MNNVKQTLEFLEKNIQSIEEFELVSLEEAKDRIIACEYYAKKDLPSFDNSALDGYAFNYKDRNNALSIKGVIFAGDKKQYTLEENECYKIMTGGKMPKNADTVLMIEDEYLENGKLIIKKLPKQFNALRFKGEELKKGQLILQKGECLNPAKIALLASQGIYKVKVFRVLRIGIFSSGNELKEPWQSSDEDSVYNSNALACFSLFQKMCFKISYLGIIKDDFTLCKEALNNQNYDILLTSGGASVGEADFMQKVLRELNFKDVFSGVNAKMLRPTKLYKKEKSFVLILPGNPMSAFLSCYLFGLKLAFLLCGHNYKHPIFTAKMAENLNLKEGRDNLILGKLKDAFFYPLASEKLSSAMISSLKNVDFLLISSKELKQKESVKIIGLFY